MLNLTEEIVKNYIEDTFGAECECGEVKALEILGVEDIETVYLHGCKVGVNGFMTYEQTKKFFEENFTEILDEVENYKNEYPCEYLEKIEFSANGLTWFFVEQAVARLVADVEYYIL